MRKSLRIPFLIIALSVLSGCAGNKNAVMWSSPDFNFYKSQVYTILPFEDRNAEKYKTDYPDAAEVVRDAFETAFLKTKNRIVERRKLQFLLSEKKFAQTGLSEEQGIEIGKMLNADIVVFGTVKSFYKGSILGSYTTVGFSARAVKVTTGEIVWKGSHTKSTSWDYAYEPAAFAEEVADELVQELISQGNI